MEIELRKLDLHSGDVLVVTVHGPSDYARCTEVGNDIKRGMDALNVVDCKVIVLNDSVSIQTLGQWMKDHMEWLSK